MIHSLIIDDEADARNALKMIVEKYCPNVMVSALCETPQKGLEAIIKKEPDLVFLDVQMPQMSGFDLLERIDDIHFDVIFVTAYDRYAIKAIRFSALDYLLKPVDPDDLVSAVQKVEKRTHQNDKNFRYKSVMKNVKNHQTNIAKLAIPDSDGITFVETENIICCRADGNYTMLYLKGSKSMIVSKPLKDFDLMLSESGFIRIHNASLINMQHIKKYVKGEGGYVILTNDIQADISRRKKHIFLQALSKI